MSSFVIEKREYMKAAGIVYGAMLWARDDWWIYDEKLGRNMNTNDMIAAFRRLYEENLADVCEKYGDHEKGDPMSYAEDVKDAVAIWTVADHRRRCQIVSEMHSFFDSIRYQIEDKERFERVSAFLDKVLLQMYKQLKVWDHEPDSWGELRLKETA